jgi:hypothetical protein
MSVESEMQTLVQKKYGSQSRPLSGLGIGVLCLVALVTATNQGNLTPPLFLAIMCLPMLLADFRKHHNKLFL